MQINHKNSESSNKHLNVKLEKNDLTKHIEEDIITSSIRQRHPTFNNSSATQAMLINNDGRLQPRQLNRSKYRYLVIVSVLILFCSFEALFKNNPKSDEGFNYENDKETKVMSEHHFKIHNLGVTVGKSGIVAQNRKPIKDELNELDKKIESASDELEIFHHRSGKFLLLLANRIEEPSLKEIENSIREHLNVIEKQISRLQEQLDKVIESFSLVQRSTKSARGYLIDGEREAEEALKKHWSRIVIDSILRKRTESELKQIEDMSSDIQAVQKIPTTKDIKCLENAVINLKKQHTKFSSAERQLVHMPTDSSYFGRNNPRNIECTEFTAMIDKPNNAYLKKIRIWSSDIVNNIGFFYSDDTYDIYGAPGDDDHYDFDWHKGEKIKHILVRIETVLYAIQFHTDRGRDSEWHGETIYGI
ncbi:20116_t:CDS:2 [Dentiscutata erythropus]|uniref:20116_t:CDS:1 n=1 Tax=Dentiscutata erythropus TaxID=1348616 RepID=A0A9N8Z5P6_9GLOM|nr:20116_t:CDS:2 [Dentiscutata erythropus]